MPNVIIIKDAVSNSMDVPDNTAARRHQATLAFMETSNVPEPVLKLEEGWWTEASP